VRNPRLVSNSQICYKETKVLKLDTNKLARQLERHGFTPEAADGVVEALVEIQDNLVTTDQLENVENRLMTHFDHAIERVDHAIERAVAMLRGDLANQREEVVKLLAADKADILALHATDKLDIVKLHAADKIDLIKELHAQTYKIVAMLGGLFAIGSIVWHFIK